MNKDKYYTTFDVIRIIDLKMERLQDWLKRGYIEPTTQEQVGRGMKKYFDRLDLYIIQTFKYLVENGIARDEANIWTKDIRKSILADREFRKLPGNQKKRIYDHLSKLPTYIVFSKGIAESDIAFGGQKDMMMITKEGIESIDLTMNKHTDAIHIINFSKIIKQVDARLEE